MRRRPRRLDATAQVVIPTTPTSAEHRRGMGLETSPRSPPPSRGSGRLSRCRSAGLV